MVAKLHTMFFIGPTINKGYDLLSITFQIDLTLRYDLVYRNCGYFDVYLGLLVGAVVCIGMCYVLHF